MVPSLLLRGVQHCIQHFEYATSDPTMVGRLVRVSREHVDYGSRVRGNERAECCHSVSYGGHCRRIHSAVFYRRGDRAETVAHSRVR